MRSLTLLCFPRSQKRDLGHPAWLRFPARRVRSKKPTSQDSLLSEQRLLWAGENVDCDQGSGEARPGADTERPARAEVVGNPTNDRCADWRSPKCNANPQGHHSAPHRWFGRELHDAVGAVGEGQASRADDRESCSKSPVSRRQMRPECSQARRHQLLPKGTPSLVCVGRQQTRILRECPRP